MNPRISHRFFGTLLCFFLVTLVPSILIGQDSPAAGAGTITGRVFNPATGEYVRNAQVRIEETGQSEISGPEGDFRFSAVPAGEYTLMVVYTGFRAERRTVTVTPGGSTTARFELVSTLQRESASDDVTVLEAFEVSTERTGNAKAIMDQRHSMNITNTVAADIFGDDVEGNLGEFLKHMPGVNLGELSSGEARNIGLRGLSPEYTSITVDGVSLSSTDPNTGGDSRAFTVEQVSLSSMDSIEISKTISADVDANAPAGTINLRTKRAFERDGRRIVVQANLAAHSEALHFNRNARPGDFTSRKIRPGGMFEYSDVFLDKRLGVVFSMSQSNIYQDKFTTQHSYDLTPTAADPRPVVIEEVEMTHIPRSNERFTTSLTTDFKATDHLVLSLATIFNWSDLLVGEEGVVFKTGDRDTVIGANPMVSFQTTSEGSVSLAPSLISKRGETFTYIPRFEYNVGDIVIDGKFASSTSRGWYDPLGEHGAIRNMVSPTANGVAFQAERSSELSADWRITQLSGPDLANGLNYTSTAANLNDGRSSRTQVSSGDINVSFKTRRLLPIVWKTGVKRKKETFYYENLLTSIRGEYIGLGSAAVGGWAPFPSDLVFDASSVGGSVTTLSGNPIFQPNLYAIGQAYLDRPQDFEYSASATQYYNAMVQRTRNYDEQVDAAFLMGTATIGKATFRAGVRYEETSTHSLDFDPLSRDEVAAAGFPVGHSRATTIPGIDYQFFSKPRVHRKGKYDNIFPSASFKYNISDNLDLQLGYSSTIRRPTISQVAGVWSVNNAQDRVAVPNVGLTPETSDNYSMRLAYYFEPVGIFAVNFFQNTVDGLFETNELTDEEFGNTDPELDGYTFVTTTNSEDLVRIRGMELEYSQSLSFLPGPLAGIGLRGSYTRNYAERILTRVSPHAASFGASYSYRRFNISLNGNWHDDMPTNTEGTRYIRQRTSMDLNTSYRLSQRYRLFINARNLTNEPYIVMDKFDGVPALMLRHQVFGTTWTAGIKAVF